MIPTADLRWSEKTLLDRCLPTRGRHPPATVSPLSEPPRRSSAGFTPPPSLRRYHYSLPNQSWADRRPVIEASPNYFSMMVDAFDDLERFTLYDPDIKCG